ncbi:hypothetical protein CsSME_00037656 [Camellia sinensis var. sinensis]
MAISHALTLFPDLNETLEGIHDIDSSNIPRSTQVPTLNPIVSLDQLLVAKSNIDANAHTLKMCVEAVTAVSNLSHRL